MGISLAIWAISQELSQKSPFHFLSHIKIVFSIPTKKKSHKHHTHIWIKSMIYFIYEKLMFGGEIVFL